MSRARQRDDDEDELPTAADYDDDDKPRRGRTKRGQSSKGGFLLPAILGGIAVLLVVVLAGVGYLVFRSHTATVDIPRKGPVGWQEYEPPGSGFKVFLPAPPVIDEPTSERVSLRGAVGRMYRSPQDGFSGTKSGVLCGVGRLTLPAGVPDDQKRLRGFQLFGSDEIERARGATVTSREAASIGGQVGEEVIVEIRSQHPGDGPDVYWVLRSAAFGNDVVVMGIWKERTRPDPEMVTGFFGTFEITGAFKPN
jgi:hypothetical protein